MSFQPFPGPHEPHPGPRGDEEGDLGDPLAGEGQVAVRPAPDPPRHVIEARSRSSEEGVGGPREGEAEPHHVLLCPLQAPPYPAAEAPCAVDELPPLLPHANGGRPHQPLHPLAVGPVLILNPHPRPAEGLRRRLLDPAQGLPHPLHDELGGGRGGLLAPPHLVQHRAVLLMADPHHHREGKGGYRPAEGLRVEPREVGAGAPAPADEHSVELVGTIPEPVERVENRCLRARALDPRPMDDDLEREPRFLERAQDVVFRIRAEACHEADPQRELRKRQRSVAVDEALRREPAHDLLAAARDLAQGVGEIEVAHRNLVPAPLRVEVHRHQDAYLDLVLQLKRGPPTL